ncbi:hypothetical protein HRW18_32045 [Streptomyces lunaelactis]|uniref:hypothetical protein n=1 Tax=Streptomyces lunaelactis TaxID=1535768 RepID=UPI0015858542|nr:hypothetical protein [Streptomyces lunaelactis]NUK12524.1 hypothetical protein [Streptomyces lunaelactis]NUK75207.1 hypothetical protein [Streptomyces lunaelactis]NUL14644.1 hypothetical protein [Streptomyces lunaelactis]NUL27422.1 hypothetical protein [Streptomyces lunaelactis]
MRRSGSECGSAEAVRWFEAARRAHQCVEAADKALTYQFGFAAHLDREIAGSHGPSLARAAAREAMKALYELARRDAAADVDVFLDCALRACERSSGQPGSRQVAAGASA